MPTTNPVPSQDPSDLLFNAGKLDEVLNGTGNSFTDRLGVARRTVAGMNSDFDAQLADAESDLNVYRADAAASAAQALGYLNTIRTTSYGAYASDPATDPLGNPPNVGDEYFNTTSNLLKRFNGTTWQASDINTANLAAPSGSSLLGYDSGTVQDVLDSAKPMQSYTAIQTYTGRATAIRITTPGIHGFFWRDDNDTTSVTDYGTIFLDAMNRRWKRILDQDAIPEWFGAVGNGVADDSLAVSRCLAAFNVVHLKKKYRINSPVVQTRQNIVYGDGENTGLISSASDLLHIGKSDGTFDGSQFKNITLTSEVGGGHIFVQKGQVVRYTYSDLVIDQRNDAKHIYKHDEGFGNCNNNLWLGGKYYHTYTATVPGFKYISTSAVDAVNVNQWHKPELVRASKPWFYFESQRDGNYIYDIYMESPIFEVSMNGLFVGLGVNNVRINEPLVFDLTSQYTPPGQLNAADLFVFGRGTHPTNGQPSRSIHFIDYKRTDADAALNGYKDIKFLTPSSGSSAVDVTFKNCSRTIAVNIIAELNSVLGVTTIDSRITLSGSYTNHSNISSTGSSFTDLRLAAASLKSESLAMAATVNNFAVSADSTAVFMAPDAARNFTGIVAPVGAVSGVNRMLYLYNTSATFSVTLIHASNSSSANQFYCPSATAYVIPPLSGVMVAYDAGVSKWVVLGK